MWPPWLHWYDMFIFLKVNWKTMIFGFMTVYSVNRFCVHNSICLIQHIIPSINSSSSMSRALSSNSVDKYVSIPSIKLSYTRQNYCINMIGQQGCNYILMIIMTPTSAIWHIFCKSLIITGTHACTQYRARNYVYTN